MVRVYKSIFSIKRTNIAGKHLYKPPVVLKRRFGDVGFSIIVVLFMDIGTVFALTVIKIMLLHAG